MNAIRAYARQYLNSPSAYPITGLYIWGVILGTATFQHHISITNSLLVFTLVSCVTLMISMGRELRVVHHLVNSQRDELVDRIEKLLDRIDDLQDALSSHDVDIPPQRPDGGHAEERL